MKAIKISLCLLALWLSVATAVQAQTVSVLSNRMMLDGKRQLINQSAEAVGLELRIEDIGKLDDSALKARFNQSDFVLVDLPRVGDISAFEQRRLALGTHRVLPYLLISRTSSRYEQIPDRVAEMLKPYYANGGKDNMASFFTGLAQYLRDGTLADLPPLRELPVQGAYHPDFARHFTPDPKQVIDEVMTDHQKPIIAIGFHVRYLEADDMQHIDQLVRLVEAAGANALPVFYELGPGAKLAELLKDIADVLIHTQPVYHNGLRDELMTLGIPVLQAIGWWNDSQQGWENNKLGLSLASTPLYLALPEQNGLIDPMLIFAESQGRIELIDYQARSLVQKAIKLAKLNRLPVADKKLAVMVYNYPPGEKNMSASFMNVPRSLEVLSRKWQQQGYQTRVLSEREFIDGLGASIQATYDNQAARDITSGFLPLQSYHNWFNALPESARQRINAYWGTPEQSTMLTSQQGIQGFAIPHVAADNLVYLGQPPRGLPGKDNEKSLYHDMRVPVNHYYLATYLWVRDTFNADALIHFGTHGTQEWMPGKERGLSIYDDPYLALGDIPVIYPYIIDNVGEATQAKRRGRAVMISHQTPPFRPSGLHGQLVDMHLLIHQWETLEPGPVKDNTVKRLLDMATRDELDKDLGWHSQSASQKPAEFILALHDYLHALAAQSQPLGLHTYAAQDDMQQKLTTVLQMLGDDFIQAFTLDQPGELFVDDYEKLTHTLPYRWLQALLSENKPIESNLPEWQAKARDYYLRLEVDGEWQALDKASRAEHIEPGIGGDPIRVPDSLPSGKNLVGFDPSRIPTREAYLAGKAAAEQMITSFKQNKGEYPKRLAFSLWAVEAMRHGGILESQAFYAMGVEPIWDRGGRVDGFKVIPREELGRPRVDVVLSATGLYRDQFPNVMAHLAKAAESVAQLDEADNAVHQHSQMLLADLLKRNVAPEQAKDMANTRVFGSPTGVYGTGLEDAALATDTWDKDDKLARLYLQRMSHAFGPNPSQWGQAEDFSELYAQNLTTVDAALLARTSNLYGMLTTDDPFQYLGGIDLAVRHLTGKSPELYISNQRQAGAVKFQTAGQFLAMEMTTRAFHPNWIKSMQEEGFAGALNLQDMTNNLWGWQVVSPEVVQDHQWQRMHEIYVMDSLDLDMQAWFEQHSAEAQLRMMERMLDAIRKGYWDASEQTRQELVEAYQHSLDKHDLRPAHQVLAEFADQLAIGFGLNAVATTALTEAQPQTPQNTQASGEAMEVSGQKLQKAQSRQDTYQPQWWYVLVLLLPFLAGIIRQYMNVQRFSPLAKVQHGY